MIIAIDIKVANSISRYDYLLYFLTNSKIIYAITKDPKKETEEKTKIVCNGTSFSMTVTKVFILDEKRIVKLDVDVTTIGCSPIYNKRGTITNPPPIPNKPASVPVTKENRKSLIFC